jgi:predicted RNA-binding Zn ribbon-like protein
MEPLFLGSHPALDFLNTRLTPQGEDVELLGDGNALARWLQGAGLLDAATAAGLRRRLGAEALDSAAANARALREWARDWLARWRQAPRGDYRRELRHLNALLENARWTRHAAVTKTGIEVRESCRVESAQELAALLAAQVAALVAHEAPELVKQCAGSGCSLWFVDRTRAHARLFCSPSACGNRAKVAAFRARRRQQGRRA